LPKLNLPAIHALADRLNPAAADTAYRAFTALLAAWLGRMIRCGAHGAPKLDILPEEVIEGEAAAMSRLLATRSRDRWVEVWEKIGRLFARADSVNLERRQVILDAFLALQKAAST
jgi:DNA polymerase-3 subunit delta'